MTATKRIISAFLLATFALWAGAAPFVAKCCCSAPEAASELQSANDSSGEGCHSNGSVPQKPATPEPVESGCCSSEEQPTAATLLEAADQGHNCQISCHASNESEFERPAIITNKTQLATGLTQTQADDVAPNLSAIYQAEPDFAKESPPKLHLLHCTFLI